MFIKRNSEGSSSVLGEVLRLHARGLSVFPVSIETKKPLVEWGRLQDNLPTTTEVTEWFTPNHRAVGVACGPISNLFLLDFDFAKHPEAREFYETHSFPRTWKEQTASGGIHLYFKWDGRLESKQTNTVSRLHRGVDSRGHGGYAKVCPSKGYQWIIPPHLSPLATIPQWLVDLLPDKETREVPDTFKQKPDDWMVRELENVDPKDPINGRTPTFVRAIGRLKLKGLTALETKTFLLPYAQRYQYPGITGLIEDQYRRYPPKAEVQSANDHSLKSAMATKKTIPFIIPGFIGVNTINIMAGLQESRKSWLLLDMAVSIASGTPWLGKYPCSHGRVVIIDQERPGDEMKRRLEALWSGRGLSVDDLEGSLIPKADLDPKFMLNQDDSFAVFEKMIDEIRPTVVLMDSLSAIQSGDIMSKADMQKLFERLKLLRLRYKTAFVILHHENKGTYEAMREKQIVTAEHVEGSGVINQVPEGIFIIRNFDGNSSVMYHVKNSYGTKLPPFTVKVRDMTPDRSQIAVEAS